MNTKYNLEQTCDYCSKVFTRKSNDESTRSKRKITRTFCSKACRSLDDIKIIQLPCKNCSKLVERIPSHLQKNTFCSKSCAAIYNNAHKTHGTRRSKLEKYLEKKLQEEFSTLDIHFNRKDAINSELDIYIPSLKLAFELNGIYHYEPIHGPEKLASIKNNDQRKFQACLEQSIELCIIDTSSFDYFKEDRAKKFLDIILTVVKNKLAISQS